MVLFIIWILGCFINCYLVYNYYDNKEPVNYLDFDFRVNIIEDVIKTIFIFSSFIGLIAYFIFKHLNKL